jgi:hypothetical protein
MHPATAILGFVARVAANVDPADIGTGPGSHLCLKLNVFLKFLDS